MRELSEVILQYTAEDGAIHEQPLTDVATAGTLIDPETGDDMELTGWRISGGNSDDVHAFIVTVTGCSAEQADQVLNERISPDEDYGFPYEIGYSPA